MSAKHDGDIDKRPDWLKGIELDEHEPPQGRPEVAERHVSAGGSKGTSSSIRRGRSSTSSASTSRTTPRRAAIVRVSDDGKDRHLRPR